MAFSGGVECDEEDNYTLNITRSIPQPIQNIKCQDLLNHHPVKCKKYGNLRQHNAGNVITNLLNPHPQKYVIIHEGCLYIYNNENSNKAEHFQSLFGFTQVERTDSPMEKLKWAFKISFNLSNKGKYFIFIAANERDRLEWMKCIKYEMLRANQLENRSDTMSETSDYSGLETPLDGHAEMFETIRRAPKMRVGLGNLLDEEDYVDAGSIHRDSGVDSIDNISMSPSGNSISSRPLPSLPKPPPSTHTIRQELTKFPSPSSPQTSPQTSPGIGVASKWQPVGKSKPPPPTPASKFQKSFGETQTTSLMNNVNHWLTKQAKEEEDGDETRSPSESQGQQQPPWRNQRAGAKPKAPTPSPPKTPPAVPPGRFKDVRKPPLLPVDTPTSTKSNQPSQGWPAPKISTPAHSPSGISTLLPSPKMKKSKSRDDLDSDSTPQGSKSNTLTRETANVGAGRGAFGGSNVGGHGKFQKQTGQLNLADELRLKVSSMRANTGTTSDDDDNNYDDGDTLVKNKPKPTPNPPPVVGKKNFGNTTTNTQDKATSDSNKPINLGFGKLKNVFSPKAAETKPDKNKPVNSPMGNQSKPVISGTGNQFRPATSDGRDSPDEQSYDYIDDIDSMTGKLPSQSLGGSYLTPLRETKRPFSEVPSNGASPPATASKSSGVKSKPFPTFVAGKSNTLPVTEQGAKVSKTFSSPNINKVGLSLGPEEDRDNNHNLKPSNQKQTWKQSIMSLAGANNLPAANNSSPNGKSGFQNSNIFSTNKKAPPPVGVKTKKPETADSDNYSREGYYEAENFTTSTAQGATIKGSRPPETCRPETKRQNLGDDDGEYDSDYEEPVPGNAVSEFCKACLHQGIQSCRTCNEFLTSHAIPEASSNYLYPYRGRRRL